jgi:hypothetical protein
MIKFECDVATLYGEGEFVIMTLGQGIKVEYKLQK